MNYTLQIQDFTTLSVDDVGSKIPSGSPLGYKIWENRNVAWRSFYEMVHVSVTFGMGIHMRIGPVVVQGWCFNRVLAGPHPRQMSYWYLWDKEKQHVSLSVLYVWKA